MEPIILFVNKYDAYEKTEVKLQQSLFRLSSVIYLPLDSSKNACDRKVMISLATSDCWLRALAPRSPASPCR